MIIKRRRHWFWNLLIVLTLIVCALAFMAHYKSWTKIENDTFKVLSGIYYKELPFLEMDSVAMVEKIPPMERISGFSVKAMEKGVFKDSLSLGKTYVFVDDLHRQKIRLVYRDSLKLFLNFSDSTETSKMYLFLKAKIDTLQK